MKRERDIKYDWAKAENDPIIDGAFGFGPPMAKVEKNGRDTWEQVREQPRNQQPPHEARTDGTGAFHETPPSEEAPPFFRSSKRGRARGQRRGRVRDTVRSGGRKDFFSFDLPFGRRKRGEGIPAGKRGARPKVSISISPGFVLLMAALLYFDRQGVLIWMAPVCAAHELAHWVVIHFAGGGISAIRLSIAGAALEMQEERPMSYPRELMATLAGPAANLVITFAAAYMGKTMGLEAAYLVSGLSLGFMVFNLLPAEPLDGGRAIYMIVAWIFSPTAASYVLRVLSIFTSIGTTALGCYIIMKGGGFTLLTTGLWLMWKTFLPRKTLVKIGLSV